MSIKEAIDCLALLDPAKAEEARKELDKYLKSITKMSKELGEIRWRQYDKATKAVQNLKENLNEHR